MQIHRYSGYALLGLLVFRIYWGFAGSSTARFANFLRGPRAMLDYAKQLPSRGGVNEAPGHNPPGHNPLGALSALVLLTLLLMQVLLGLFAVDVDGIESGPLSHLVSFEAGRASAEWHEACFNVLLAFIALHLAAIVFYLLYKRDNLIAPMITGYRRPAAGSSNEVVFASWGKALVGVALAVVVTWGVARGFWT
jgi:cytochrome b